ncbi:unnamed protein product [Lymnaea stagnalis]|uniref:Ig-like domain-containing protein n=1 Tax=Lymnaea stagnalis TaxID=6523 RepID=A0AAV2H071_LYMST
MEDTVLLLVTLVLGTIYVSHDVGVLANKVNFEDIKFVMERRPLKIRCIGVSEKDATVEIMRSGPLPSDFKIESAQEKISDGKFRITVTATKESADLADGDTYLCDLKVNSTRLDATHLYLEIIQMYTRGANVTEGHETSLSCEPQAPMQPLITWFKDGVSLDVAPNVQGRVQYTRDNMTVTLADAKPSDGGLYSCRMDFTLYHPGQVFWENVTLQAKPYIQKWDADESLISVTNDSIVLKCPAGGYPPPQVFWLRGDDVLESSPNVTMSPFNGLTTGQLNITKATEAEFGQYSCTAENTLGKAAMPFDVSNPNKIGNGVHPTRKSPAAAMLEMFFCFSFLAMGSWLTT